MRSSETVGPFQAVLLDMDGTLVDSDAVVERVWRGWAARQGMDPEEVLRVAHGRQAHATMAVLLPERPAETNRAENDELLAIEKADVDGIVPVPGAPGLLADLAGSGVPYALVTSADVGLATARMEAAGLTMPLVRVTAESVSVSKPDPEGFLKGAAELGHEPTRCVAFEDSAMGIAAARAAGMAVVGVGPRAAEFGPTVAVPDLTTIRLDARADGSVLLHVEPTSGGPPTVRP